MNDSCIIEKTSNIDYFKNVNKNLSDSCNRIIISKFNKNFENEMGKFDSQISFNDKMDSSRFKNFEDNLNSEFPISILGFQSNININKKSEKLRDDKLYEKQKCILKGDQDSSKLSMSPSANKKNIQKIRDAKRKLKLVNKRERNENSMGFETETYNSSEINFGLYNHSNKIRNIVKLSSERSKKCDNLIIARRSSFYKERENYGKILIVYDQKHNRDIIVVMIQNLLRFSGKYYEIVECNDGIDTLNIIIDNYKKNINELKLIISGNLMKYINGINSLELIRKMEIKNNSFKTKFVLLLEEFEYKETNDFDNFIILDCDMVKKRI